jgi:transcriptional regulator of acetoin/glycerol metabolism
MLILGGAPFGGDLCPESCNLMSMVAFTERRAIAMALARANNNRTQAARLLGIKRPLLYKKMRSFGIQ